MSRSHARRRAVCRIEVPMALNRDGLAGPFWDANLSFLCLSRSTWNPSSLFIRPFSTVNLYDIDIYTRYGRHRHAHTGSGISTQYPADPAATGRPLRWRESGRPFFLLLVKMNKKLDGIEMAIKSNRKKRVVHSHFSFVESTNSSSRSHWKNWFQFLNCLLSFEKKKTLTAAPPH